jgi:hypothetical protein
MHRLYEASFPPFPASWATSPEYIMVGFSVWAVYSSSSPKGIFAWGEEKKRATAEEEVFVDKLVWRLLLMYQNDLVITRNCKTAIKLSSRTYVSGLFQS